MKEEYFLMDGRAASNTDDATVLDIGTGQEMCSLANEGSMGNGCVVVDSKTMQVMWGWFSTGIWEVSE